MTQARTGRAVAWLFIREVEGLVERHGGYFFTVTRSSLFPGYGEAGENTLLTYDARTAIGSVRLFRTQGAIDDESFYPSQHRQARSSRLRVSRHASVLS
ncbi:hypothetical protein [Bradyrhizobium sp. UFLA03-84]|uniref:hypothetical protein n=1 Tax=Bradyrhizobium sp. UFLA03-84 TaxID=418599 RepID=UPI00117857BC|nr:hypothetical protein [Bradyrhizobium sp. UFLA03-84]